MRRLNSWAFGGCICRSWSGSTCRWVRISNETTGLRFLHSWKAGQPVFTPFHDIACSYFWAGGWYPPICRWVRHIGGFGYLSLSFIRMLQQVIVPPIVQAHNSVRNLEERVQLLGEQLVENEAFASHLLFIEDDTELSARQLFEIQQQDFELAYMETA